MRVPHRLPAVHHVLAVLVAVAMLSTSGPSGFQHVHAYADHDHADHHHGPASHGHSAIAHAHAPDSHADDDARLEACDPGEHAVSVVFTYVAPHPDHVPSPVTLETIIVVPPEQRWRHFMPRDVRAHSPPRPTDAPLRAPPVVHLA
jgi:hypothetical protein